MSIEIHSATKSATEGSKATISLVLPAWNESEALPRAVEEADKALRSVADEYEILVVNDGSTDGTAECLENLASEYPALRAIHHEQNRGYGAALRTGFAAARCDLVMFTDADVQFDLSEVRRFVVLAEDYDIVCGYRIDRKDSPLRCFYSRGYNLLVRTLIGTSVRDIDCAFKMFRREKLQQLEITTDGFLVNTELLTGARQRGFSVVEVGVTHRPRCEGQSTVSVTHIPVVLTNLLRFWWNRIQFPNHPQSSSVRAASDPSQLRYRWMQYALLLVAAMLLLSTLSYPLIDRDETRYAEIPREMVVTGDWIVPQLNFETYYDKPPLLYWACAVSYTLFGVSAWSARLVPAVGGLATLATTMFFANRMFDRKVGFLTGLVLFLSVGFLGASRILVIDGLLTLCVAISLFAAYEAIREGTLNLGWWIMAAVAAGFAFLSKGPISLVLFLPPVFAYAWLTEGTHRVRLRDWLLFFTIVAGISAPWFVAVTQRVPDFAYQFFWLHNVERFGGAFHVKPIWFFIPVVLVGGHPWSFLALPCLNYLTTRKSEVQQLRPQVLGFLVMSAAWCFAFFSISSCKLPAYILPAAPALAMVIAKYLEVAVWQRPALPWTTYAVRWAPGLATLCSIATGIGFAVYGIMMGYASPITFFILLGIAAAVTLASYAWRGSRWQPMVSWSICSAATLLVGIFILHQSIPQYAVANSLFGPSSPWNQQLVIDDHLPIVTTGNEWSGVPFYLNRDDIKNYPTLSSADAIAKCNPKGQLLLISLKHKSQDSQPYVPAGFRVITEMSRGRAQLQILEQNTIARPVNTTSHTR
ncbi:glycosyltransferase [Aeoliella mucimassa]|uniref:Undecaprenyl phosphate-alpha-4-amino-4-deoxy-L-arabinose arabinosyl transferase n=1 Tax=Aeoliella mucimassa TaxID=2527972 RepID=A0A518ARA4_9BACT|nr:glycosyltransferase [Aeoliella mucimassa]QDU57235.1 Undecaprenyl phosphate-alpha-4-amino-4-deoxy-L-arabinose arabinosyl transferase [Aeoliella mucimassa]